MQQRRPCISAQGDAPHARTDCARVTQEPPNAGDRPSAAQGGHAGEATQGQPPASSGGGAHDAGAHTAGAGGAPAGGQQPGGMVVPPAGGQAGLAGLCRVCSAVLPTTRESQPVVTCQRSLRYANKHGFCFAHLKEEEFVLSGERVRFCQKCSRLQPIAEVRTPRRKKPQPRRPKRAPAALFCPLRRCALSDASHARAVLGTPPPDAPRTRRCWPAALGSFRPALRRRWDKARSHREPRVWGAFSPAGRLLFRARPLSARSLAGCEPDVPRKTQGAQRQVSGAVRTLGAPHDVCSPRADPHARAATPPARATRSGACAAAARATQTGTTRAERA